MQSLAEARSWVLVAGLLATACSRCGAGTGDGSPAAQGVTAAASSANPSPSADGGPHALAPRRTPELEALRAARPRVLQTLERSRVLARKDAGAAAALLASMRPVDPLGAGLALEVLRIADPKARSLHRAWAEEASPLVEGRPELEGLLVALRRMPPTISPSAPRVSGTTLPGSARDLDAACQLVQAALRRGELAVRPGGSSPAASSRCEPDVSAGFKAAGGLSRATALRVTIDDKGERVLAFLTLHTAEGLRVHGPLADVWNPPDYQLTNDIELALERVDVLHGGAPEVVLRVTERRTLPDLVLNEVVSLDQTRMILVSLDRGGLQVSRELVLARRVLRETLDSAATAAPGFPAQASPPGVPAEFRMKVRWGSNEIELTRESGELAPPLEGKAALFE